MNHLFLTNIFINEEQLSKDVATYLIKNNLKQIQDWGDFLIFENNNYSNFENQGKILTLGTQTKDNLSETILPLFIKYSEPVYLMIGSLGEISLSMQQGLLRFIEEPPQNLNIILTTRSKTQVLDTIISRTDVKTLPSKIAFKYIDKAKNEELTKFLPNPKEFLQYMLQNKKINSPEFKSINREGLEIWLWQLEYLVSEIGLKNGLNDNIRYIYNKIVEARSLNQANVLNRLVWAKLII